MRLGPIQAPRWMKSMRSISLNLYFALNFLTSPHDISGLGLHPRDGEIFFFLLLKLIGCRLKDCVNRPLCVKQRKQYRPYLWGCWRVLTGSDCRGPKAQRPHKNSKRPVLPTKRQENILIFFLSPKQRSDFISSRQK